MASCLASASSKFKYDVFITLRDPKGCVKGYVVNKLRDAGIRAFVDDEEEEVFSVQEAVSGSMIVMVLFTPEFLTSKKCLKRLVARTMWWNDNAMPVFCGVSRRQVHDEMVALAPRFDLTGVASRPGFKLSVDSGNEFSSCMSNLGFSMLHDESFHDLPCYQVGLPLRVRELLNILGLKYILSDDTIIVGIWGDGGIGKTTIAKAIYDRIGGNFDGKSFLSNIKDVWKEGNGEILLKNQLISDISETKLDKTDDVVMHELMMQELSGRRVLVVLDDVNCEFQLKELCGNVKWCGKGSLIFITARNKAILDAFADISYEMKRLNRKESLKLFCLHAFKKFTPTNDFEDFSEQVIGYCEGLPLALEVFGSLLHNRTKNEWEKMMNNMGGISCGPMQKKLKISCELLTDIEKDIFFNIASFYVGQSKHHVTQLLKSSRLPAETGMSVIIERNLVKVMNDKLYVHDLLQEMGKEISHSKPKFIYNYDVFLSFRGDDTRKSFTSHLCSALKQAGIEVYMDEERIEKGENISSSLLEAIESSRISIIIFSKNYAGSSWCLQELEKVMECYKTTHQEVLPIFFDVRPFEVRKQQNAFGKAWERLIKRTSSGKMKKLTTNVKRALTEAANLSGWDMHNYRTEVELIGHVTETVRMKIGDNKCLFVAHHPVGLKSRVQDIIQLLSSKSNEVIISGIWGMGGVGKTTIAKAIYNEVGQSFDGKCFLANVREVWKQDNGPVYLQEQLLSSILKSRRMTLPDVEMGKTLVKEILCKKKVIVVLDDMNNEDQLKALCGSLEWFGQGSRIIITTRDQHLLNVLRVIHVYSVKELDDNESLELFSWHAFKQAIPEQDFIELSRRIVSYSGGLPLALEILGSYLYDREILIWRSVLERLQQIPNDQIHEKLKISYDGLSDDIEKEIFLDICCFFIGKNKSDVTQILNGCGLHADIGISRLIERSLVRVGNKNKLEMHDLLRDMGREIIRQQSLEEPEKRTRLWFHDNVLDVLRDKTGTMSIKGLALNLSMNNSLYLSAKTFKNMRRLRLLQLDNVQLIGDYSYLSTNLRWLCWHGFPLESLPMNFNLEKIVAIDLKWSNLVKVWEKSQLLEGLKILNLSHSHCLIETPDFSKIPYLEKLILKDCPRLSIIHHSIGDLQYIVLLNLKDCKSLSHLPRSVYQLKSLKTLNLSGCSKFEKLEEDIEQMESLTTLMANQTSMAQVPFSLLRLKSIKYVSLCGYEGLSRDVFPSLSLSWMSPSTHYSKSLSQAFWSMPALIRGLSHPLFSRRYETSEARPSTSQVSCQNAPALLEFHDQVHRERSETLMSSLIIPVGQFNKITDALLKSISKID
ncbi:TMV resistance protein N-like isoform X2 [Neltuma alba]|uniref:TMV resistance protein N-like isoform X2 n=1 Tax=Neltuma alba TaxID=207710 RepID=UPI0010A4085D|nr:TMV resistance protein N-like isoform X2 [Prosopis alba]